MGDKMSVPNAYFPAVIDGLALKSASLNPPSECHDGSCFLIFAIGGDVNMGYWSEEDEGFYTYDTEDFLTIGNVEMYIELDDVKKAIRRK